MQLKYYQAAKNTNLDLLVYKYSECVDRNIMYVYLLANFSFLYSM